jgi:hypothetical protein
MHPADLKPFLSYTEKLSHFKMYAASGVGLFASESFAGL